MNYIYHCIIAFVGCLGFSFIFRLHDNIKFAFIGAFNGFIATIIYLSCNFINNIIIQSFIAMFFTALICELQARKHKAPATIFMTIGAFPLVPGRGIYLAMLYASEGKISLFLDYLLETLLTAAALAFGMLFASTLILLIKRVKEKPALLFKDPYE